MASVSSSCTFENILIKIDQYSDYVPVWSTVTNLIAIFEKYVGNWICCQTSSEDHEYCKYIQDKSYRRCALLLLPIIGNVVIAIYDFFMMYNSGATQELDEEAREYDIENVDDPFEIYQKTERALQEARAEFILSLMNGN